MKPHRAIFAALGAALLCVPLAQAQPVAAFDDTGARIALPAPARRIVALAPHITEQLFAIGAGRQIVATTEFADYPPEARRIARVARAHSIDIERVAAARADLIVVWGSGFPPGLIESLRRVGVPVYVNEPGSLDHIATSLERLGALTAATDAPRVATGFRTRVAELRAQYAARAPVRVFYQIWAQPLMTLAGTHVLNEAIRLCGGRNVFESLAPIAPQVSIEAVIAADPQIIVTAEPDAKSSEALAIWRRFAALTAVKNDRMVVLDANRINRHSPRIVEEIATLCARIDGARARG